jgi:nicotinic acid phosphoribosyltransferase
MIKAKIICDFSLDDLKFQKGEDVCLLYKLIKKDCATKKAYIVVSQDGEAITLDSGFFKLSEEEKDKLEDFKFDPDTFVYCTHCKHFRLDDEAIPYCPFEGKCDINDCENSRPFSERPLYEERRANNEI